MRIAAFGLLALGLAAAGPGCRGGGEPGGEFGGDGPLVVRLGHVGFPGSPFDHAARRFEELVEERFPGRVDIRIFGASQLGEDKEMLEGLRLGTLEMHVPSSVLHSLAPEFGLFDLPFLVEDRAHFERIAEGEIGRELAGLLETEHGITLLAFWENGFRVITNDVRPIVVPADLDGIRLRTPKDPERVRLFETLGASPASMSFGEVFTALRQGVVDGQENPLGNIRKWSWYEVQKYISISRHVYTPITLVMNLARYDSLTDDQRAATGRAARAAVLASRAYGAENDAKLLAEISELAQGKVEFNDIDVAAFQEAAKPIAVEIGKVAGEEFTAAVMAAIGQ